MKSPPPPLQNPHQSQRYHLPLAQNLPFNAPSPPLTNTVLQKKTPPPPPLLSSIPPPALPVHQPKYLFSWASTRHQPPTYISHGIVTHIFHNDTTIIPHSPRSHIPPDVAGTPIIEALEGTPTIPTIAKRSYYHLVILKHHNNEYIVDN